MYLPIGDKTNSDLVLLTGLLFTEARGEPDQGILAVAEVVRNRVMRPAWWGRGWREVILKRHQFSGLTPGNPSLHELESMISIGWTEQAKRVWEKCWRPAAFIYHAETYIPRVGVAKGADYYFVKDLILRGRIPRWVRFAVESGPPLAEIGAHWFYELGPDGLEGTQDDLIN